MKTATIIRIAALAISFSSIRTTCGDSLPVEKAAGAPKLYMHYMPWFQSPTSLGGTSSGWGLHWTMSTQNPNIVDASGKRQIASHYYPKIGPYDSTDQNVLEYHLLLMQYSGVDGALVDWYGVQGWNGDVGSLLTATNAFVNKTNSFGIKFGVVAEDRFWTVSSTNSTPDISKAQANMAYAGNNYVNQSNYIKAGPTNSPLLPIFGPITFTSSSQWNQILPSLGVDPEFLTLPGKSSMAGSNSDGEYAWPFQDAGTSNHLTKLRSFYSSAPLLKTAGGVAYPGFNDFYAEGGWCCHLFTIPDNNGQTLIDTLNTYNEWNTGLRAGNLDFLQLATFNDFGEGTMFEPTVETGFKYLDELQTFYQVKNPRTHQSLDESDLQLIYELYLARKKYAGNAATQAILSQVSSLLSDWQTDAAQTLLEQASPPGDYNADGLTSASDYNTWRRTFGNSTIIYGSGADGDYNGSIGISDYVTWRKNAVPSAGADFVASIPEPNAFTLVEVLATLLCFYSANHRKRRFALACSAGTSVRTVGTLG